MKSSVLSIAVLQLFVGIAGANPKSYDSVLAIGKDSKIVFDERFDIRPNVDSEIIWAGDARCKVSVLSSEYPRHIEVGTTLKVGGTFRHGHWSNLALDGKHEVHGITCETQSGTGLEVTIGELDSMLENAKIRLILSPSVPVK